MSANKPHTNHCEAIGGKCAAREGVNLVTLVSHSQLLWRVVTQGGVAPVFPFGPGPYLCRRVALFFSLFCKLSWSFHDFMECETCNGENRNLTYFGFPSVVYSIMVLQLKSLSLCGKNVKLRHGGSGRELALPLQKTYS